MSNFVKRLLTGIVFVAVMLVGILWRGESFAILFILINAACLYEFYKLFAKEKNVINPRLGAFLGTSFLAVLSFYPNAMVWIFLPIFLLLIYELLKGNKNPFGSVGLFSVGLIYFVLPFALLFSNTNFDWNSIQAYQPQNFLIPLLIMVWSNDTFAYLGGKLLGKHKLMPKVSPNKTIEGFISGLLFASVASFLIAYFWGDSSPIQVHKHLIAGILVGTAATAGDLLQSVSKRYAGVKDSGNLLPGHGGVWDRFDGFVLAIPAFDFCINLLRLGYG